MPGEELELASHMLEVPVTLAAGKPEIQVHHLGIGTAAWCYAGGAHHSVVSTALTRADIAMFAKLTGTEFIAIGDDTTEADLQKM